MGERTTSAKVTRWGIRECMMNVSNERMEDGDQRR